MPAFRLTLLVVCFVFAGLDASSQRWWSLQEDQSVNPPYVAGTYFRADLAALRSLLHDAPAEGSGKTLVFSVPMPDGSEALFTLTEVPVMHPDLARRFPLIRTFAGKGLTDRFAYARFDVTELGFHGMIRSPKGMVFMEPVHMEPEAEEYISYFRGNRAREADFRCLLDGEPSWQEKPFDGQQEMMGEIGKELRTYRLAVACTGEYAAVFGGTVNGALSAIVTTINRVNGIYEQELCIRMELIPDNTLILFTNAATDPYTNSNNYLMLDQNQETLDSLIGSSHYDIGHVFGTSGGGIASLASVCKNDKKGQGVTSSSAPYGDAFDVDYVCHEMGHQFGANHTFNSTTDGCQGNRYGPTAYEPGSGSTIMSYAGLCGINNLQWHSDPFFHTGSFDEMVNYVTLKEGKNCAVVSPLANNPPKPAAGLTYYIPISTPFRLESSATDADGDALTYMWDEIDKGSACDWNAITGNAPAFRSFKADTVPFRFFPKLATVILNYPSSNKGEVLANYGRVYKFRMVVRDHHIGGGGVAYHATPTTVNVVNTGVPFKVIFPNTPLTWAYNTPWTVLWDVANTTASPINCQQVNILLSLDGGFTWPIVLAANTPNDGAELVWMPNDPSLVGVNKARIIVQSVNNVFYDMSDANFTISGNVGFNDLLIPTDVQVYPNPAAEFLEVALPSSGGAGWDCRILDAGGRVIRQETVRPDGPLLRLMIGDLPSGFYLLEVRSPQGRSLARWVKQ
ncbi:MAG: M12 family metallo-peptidase [Chitinophagales bacterium]|nr:M12 family metallo-peptidase [Chitinophagales bacterium]MDW8394542.1 M12 family metallo-peptidase [Chitinophagales bacterium]